MRTSRSERALLRIGAALRTKICERTFRARNQGTWRRRGGVPPNSTVGDADRHVFRNWTAAAWTGELGIGGNRIVVGGAGPRAGRFLAHPPRHRFGGGGHARRNSCGYTGRARLRNKRSAVCGD